MKVTHEDIVNMNELYLKLKTYAAVARETGFASSTVKKYIIPNYVAQDSIQTKRFEQSDIPKFSVESFIGVEDWGALCVLSEEEKVELKEFQKEILV